MALIGTSKDYTGRTVDISLYPEISTNLTPIIAGMPFSRAIAGPSKVAQNFTRILLTPLGKYRAHPKLGSNFMLQIRNGFVKFDIDLVHLFSGESLGVIEFIKDQETDSTPSDEKILSVEMVKYSTIKGAFNMTVELTTAGGSTTKFLLPVVWSN